MNVGSTRHLAALAFAKASLSTRITQRDRDNHVFLSNVSSTVMNFTNGPGYYIRIVFDYVWIGPPPPKDNGLDCWIDLLPLPGDQFRILPPPRHAIASLADHSHEVPVGFHPVMD